MNGMTHKQALKWIDRRQDGLLKANQRELLDEHLHFCDSCRSYSEEMEVLASRLNHEFHARWEGGPGPSKVIVENVRAKAKSIPAAKRFSSGFQLAGGVTVLVILGIVINFFVSQMRDSAPVANGTEVVSSFPAAEDRLIAFSSTQNGNSDIYTMHADGSGLMNLTNDPAYDGFPHWSPDGKQIAFESDRDGSNQIYMMDADGSNVTQLTHGGDANGFLGGNIQSPWSPDGRKLIFSQNTINDEKHQFYALDIATQDTNPLTTETGKYYSPTWSPDGEHIAFILDETQENSPILRRLYIIDSQGNHHVNVTEGLPEYESVALADYYWSPDGQSITFVTDSPAGKSKPIVYKADLDGTRVQQTSSNAQILDWWNGIVVQTDPPKKVEETSLSLLRADGSQIPLQTCQSNDLPASYAIKRSSDGTLAFGMKCTQGVWMLYGVNAEGTTINKLLNSPLDARYDNLFQMTWSPDDHFLAFVAFDFDDKHIPTDLYVVIANDPSASPLKMENSSDPSWQPVLAENLLKEVSTPKPAETVSASGLIAFTAVGKNGDMDIFTVHPNGSGLTNLTNDPAIESNIAWSPDGTRLAFVSDSDGNDNIFVMNADGSDQKRLTDEPESNLAPLWSPDGQRIAYSLSDPDEKTVNLFVMDSNGENRRRLTDRHTSPDMMGVWAEEWSLDGKYIFYLDQQLISRVDIESGEITKVSPETDWPSYLLVKADSKIRFLSPCGQDSAEFCSKVKMIGEDGTGEETYQTMKLQRVCTSADPGNFYYMAKWSPDLNKILFVFSCSQDGGVFYIANGDGSDFKSVNEPGSFLYKDIHFDWSPDSQSIIFTSSPDVPHTQDLYLLNIEAALQDPGIKPSRLNLSFAQAGDLVWQPAP